MSWLYACLSELSLLSGREWCLLFLWIDAHETKNRELKSVDMMLETHIMNCDLCNVASLVCYFVLKWIFLLRLLLFGDLVVPLANLIWFSNFYIFNLFILFFLSLYSHENINSLFFLWEQSDPLYVKVNKLSSTKTQLPYDYYFLKYCKPKKILNNAENLGEVLRGDRIENSVYEVHTYYWFFL